MHQENLEEISRGCIMTLREGTAAGINRIFLFWSQFDDIYKALTAHSYHLHCVSILDYSWELWFWEASLPCVIVFISASGPQGGNMARAGGN